jgi:hypothetical protein
MSAEQYFKNIGIIEFGLSNIRRKLDQSNVDGGILSEYWTIGMWLAEYAVENCCNRMSCICAAGFASSLLLAKLKVLYMFVNMEDIFNVLEIKESQI